METHPFRLLISLLGLLALASPALAVTNYFFNPSPTAARIVSNINAVMNGDLFAVQLDTSVPQRSFRLRK